MPALVADTIPRQYILQKLTDKKSKKTILCLDFSQADM